MRQFVRRWAATALIPCALAGALLAGAPLAAQAPPDAEANLPRHVAEQVIAVYNHPATARLGGDARLPRSGELVGDVAVLGGVFSLAGVVRGSVVVINGDLRLAPGARVTGNVTVVGGAVSGLDGATIGGSVSVHRASLRFRRDEGRITHAPPPPGAGLTAGRQFEFGRTDLRLAVRGGYNRVEGLPVAAGLRAELGASNPTSLEALLIYRTESGLRLSPSEMGYGLRAEQFIGGHRAWRIGATLRSEILPIEAWGLSERENSFATFFLHRDYRDHYEREGWSAYLRYAPRGEPYDIAVEYRDERHRTVSAGGPWALVDNDRQWRPQPIIARGDLRSAAITLRYDSRNELLDPSAGWFLTATVEDGLGGDLGHAVTIDPETGVPRFEPRDVGERFTTAFVDLRRYARLGPGSRLALRLLAAGSVDGGALPPQRQHALGGEGSLPGYGLFRFDCGARAHVLEVEESRLNPPVRFFPFYGCDRAALVQAEYQGRLSLAPALGRALDRDLSFIEPAAWVLFFDAGRAWNERDAAGGRLTGRRNLAADAGLGLRFGRVGLYWAVPLASGPDGVNFFVRIGPRL